MGVIQFKRGALGTMPVAAAGEPLFSTDQYRLIIGSAGGNRLMGLFHKNDATAAPGVNDDAGDGYSVGSQWVDVTNDKVYECVDSTVGSAVWKDLTPTVPSAAITQLTGDVTAGPGSGSQAATITNNAVTTAKILNGAVTTAKILDGNVTDAKLSNMTAGTFKGRIAGAGTGPPQGLTSTQATAILDTFTSALKGLVPASGGGAVNYLRADGTWDIPPTTPYTLSFSAVAGADLAYQEDGDDDYLVFHDDSAGVPGRMLASRVLGDIAPMQCQLRGKSITGVASYLVLLAYGGGRITIDNRIHKIRHETHGIRMDLSSLSGGGLTVNKKYDIFVAFEAVSVASADPTTNVVTLAASSIWETGAQIKADSNAGGVFASSYYYWRVISPSSGTLHSTAADALTGANIVDIAATFTNVFYGITLKIGVAWTNDTTRQQSIDFLPLAYGSDPTWTWVGTIRTDDTVASTAHDDSTNGRNVVSAYHDPFPIMPGYMFGSNLVTTAEGTSGASAADLATTQHITFHLMDAADVCISTSAQHTGSVANLSGRLAVDVDGVNTTVATNRGDAASVQYNISGSTKSLALAAGKHTIKLQFYVGGAGTVTFRDRFISITKAP